MDFKQVYIKDIKRTTLPKNLLFLDTETTVEKVDKGQELNMRLCWTCHIRNSQVLKYRGGIWKSFKVQEDVCLYINKLVEKKGCLYIFAHNAFFDLQVIHFFKYLPSYGWKLEFFHEGGLTYLLVLSNNDRKIKVISTLNFFDHSLRMMGDVIGIKKLEVDFDNVDEETLSKYCKNDVMIIKVFILKYLDFLKEYDLGKFSLTRASQAMSCFRHRFMEHNICLHNNLNIIKLERQCYYGGRTECFKVGSFKNKHFITLDINSMYPFIMRNFELPWRLIDYRNSVSIKTAKTILKYHAVCCEVTVETDKPFFAVRREDKIIFPVGRFKTFLCTQALKYAIENKNVIKINRMAVYEKSILFASFVDYFYEQRMKFKKEGNKMYEVFCKKIMNSLYGKFAQKLKTQVIEEANSSDDYYRCEFLDYETAERGIETTMFSITTIDFNDEIESNNFVAISAHVTEIGRMMLYNIIEEIGRSRVYYCDTDSIKICSKDLRRVKHDIDNNKLGSLKLERVSKRLTINTNKDYIDGDKVVLKGVPQNAIKLDKDTYSYYTFLSHKSHLSINEKEKYFTRYIIKKIKRSYNKGYVDRYGNVLPFTLGNRTSSFYLYRLLSSFYQYLKLFLKKHFSGHG